jgi:hypothetical protein
MKRSLLLSLFAIAIVAMSFGQAMATISLSLNLRYTYPGIESLGGSWDLLARDDSAFGISALVVVLDNVNFGSATLNTGIGAIPIETRQSGTIVEFVYGQDPGGVAGTSKFANVGKGAGTPGNVAKDDLYPAAANSYDNMALIASGTFGAVRPSFATFPGTGGGPSDGANWNDAAMTIASATVPTITLLGGDGVRGDSTTNADDTLLPGDVDRNGTVDTLDLNVILNGFFGAAAGWDAGDVALNDGTIDTNDLNDVLNNFFGSAASPAIGAVPEPATFGLVAVAGMMLGLVRRR